MKAASSRFFQSGVVLIAVAFIALFFSTALPRLLYPYDLDFIGDSMLMQSLQIADGLPVYLPPNADFNPPNDFVRRIQSHYYSVIISDESFFDTQPDLQQLITTYYIPTKTLGSRLAPPTITGVVVRPKLIYLPKQP